MQDYTSEIHICNAKAGMESDCMYFQTREGFGRICCHKFKVIDNAISVTTSNNDGFALCLKDQGVKA
jgi:hypothetical protein